MVKKPLILAYQIENEVKAQALKKEAQDLGLEVRVLGPGDVHHKVGYLAGLEGYEASEKRLDPEKIAQSEMILFVDTPRDVLGQVLSRLQAQNFIFPHKATMTQSTKDWTFNYLVGHIEAEHAVMTAWGEMVKDVKRALAIREEAQDQDLEDALNDIQALRDLGDSISLKNVRQAHMRLVEVLDRLDDK